jgi:hypothetical protein
MTNTALGQQKNACELYTLSFSGKKQTLKISLQGMVKHATFWNQMYYNAPRFLQPIATRINLACRESVFYTSSPFNYMQ